MTLDPFLLTAGCALLGLLIGSFLNVVIHRLPKMMEQDWAAQCAELQGQAPTTAPPLGLATPRSHCPHCNRAIDARDNIPLLSYLLLGGRCRYCCTPISIRYPLVEALTGLLFAFAAWKLGPGWPLAAALAFLSAAVVLAFIDLDTQLLPDDITLPLLWLGLLVNAWNTFTDLESAVFGAVAGYLALWSVYWLFKLATGKEGMGYGDFKLLAAIGAWLGWQMLPLTILLSSLVGAVTGIALILLARRGRNVPMPFGPYLAAAGVIALFWGKPLSQLYLGTLAP
ncbi:A24 family peptidase [Denitratisoma sp. agr-D3]